MKLIKKEYSNYFSPLKKSKNSKYLSQILLKMKNFVIKNNKLNISKDNKEAIQSLLYKSKENFYSPSNDIKNFSPNHKKNIFQLYNVANNLRNKLNNKKSELELLKSLSLKQKSKKHFNSKILNNSKELILSLINEEKKDTKKKIQIDLHELSNNNSLTRNMNYKPLFFTRPNSPKYRSLNEESNNSKLILQKEMKKNYAIHRNSIIQEIILNEKSYENLNYDVKSIFKDYKYYNKYIKKRIAKLKQEIPSEEKTHRVFEKIYENSKYNKPLLTLNSLSVSFECKGNNHIFYIPFEFLPLFYYKNMAYLKMLLMSIFKIDINYDNILVDFSELSNVLENSKIFFVDIEDINKTEKKENNQKSNNSNKDLRIYKRKIQKNLTNIKMNVFNFTSFLKTNKNNNFVSHDSSNIFNITNKRDKIKRRSSLYDLKEKCFTPKHHNTRKIIFNSLKKDLKELTNKLFTSNIKENDNNTIIKEETKEEENKSLYKCSFSKFIFDWKTPKYNYNIIIKTPEAVFQINKKIIRTKIDIELIFYLLENSFKNWDFYISKYIFAYKKSIKNVESLISIKSTSNLLSHETKLLPEINSNRQNYLLKEEINRDKIKSGNTYRLTDKSKKYEFIYTDNDNNNYLKILHNFYMITYCKSINPNKKFTFDFNFFQMRTLNKILRIQGLNYFLSKLVYIDREDLSIKFRYDELSSFSNEKYLILEKQNPNLASNQISLKINERNKDIINITINFPVIETIKYQNLDDNLYSDNCFESNYDDSLNKGIPLKLLNELCYKNIKEWPDLLLKNH